MAKPEIQPLAAWRGKTTRKPVPRGRSLKDVEPAYRRIGAICLEMRERRGLTQQQVANAFGWTRAAISNLEAGKQRIMLHDLPVLAKTLGLPVKDLLPLEWTSNG